MFQKYIDDGKRLQLEKDGFQEALKRYFAAKDCMPERSDLVDSLILEMFKGIEAKRVEAEIEKKRADSERKRAEVQAGIAKKNEEDARKKGEELQQTLNALDTVSAELVQEFIDKTNDAVYELKYEEATAHLQRASRFDFNRRFKTQLTELWMELLFWYHESHQYERAEELAAEALQYIQPAKLPGPVSAPGLPHPATQKAFFAFLQTIDPGFWLDSLKARYYPDIVTVKGGIFTMGCDTLKGDRDCYEWELPAHLVEVSSFGIARTETTLWQYGLYCAASPGLNIENYAQPKDLDWGIKGRLPVIYVSWWDAAGYSNWLNKQFGRDTVYAFFGEYDLSAEKWPDSVAVLQPSQKGAYRLPTEAEWEFAARGGILATKRYRFAGSDDLDSVAWYNDNSLGRIHPAATKARNDLGLYDMSGNVWEWCQDWYEVYSTDAPPDYSGPDKGGYRVIRGGGWGHDAESCRVAYRDGYWPEVRHDAFGFRLVLQL